MPLPKTVLTEDPLVAGKLLKSGSIVVFPTETVYGIGASSFLPQKCEKIYSIKKRPLDNPLIVHVACWDDVTDIAILPDAKTYEVLQQIKEPFTLILKKKNSYIYTSGLDTVAIRIPLLQLTRKMLQVSGPVSAPSANFSGKPSITCSADAIRTFSSKVDVILKGPDSSIGLESAIIDFTGNIPVYLRPGSLSFQKLKKLLPALENYSHRQDTIAVPGMKYRHYSPEGRVVLVASARDVVSPQAAAFIGFESLSGSEYVKLIGSNQEYMRELYRFFNECDRLQIGVIYCQFPLADEHSETLLNRLNKACAG